MSILDKLIDGMVTIVQKPTSELRSLVVGNMIGRVVSLDEGREGHEGDHSAEAEVAVRRRKGSTVLFAAALAVVVADEALVADAEVLLPELPDLGDSVFHPVLLGNHLGLGNVEALVAWEGAAGAGMGAGVLAVMLVAVAAAAVGVAFQVRHIYSDHRIEAAKSDSGQSSCQLEVEAVARKSKFDV